MGNGLMKESVKRPSVCGNAAERGITEAPYDPPIPSEAITILATLSKEFLIPTYNIDCSDNTAIALAARFR